MGSTELAMSPRGQQRETGLAIWILLIFFTAAFFIIGHDFKAPEAFQLTMTAQSVDEYENINSMFQLSPWRQVAGVAIGLFGVIVLFRRPRGGAHTLDFFGTLLLFFVGWCALSLLWADDPRVTLRRLVLFAFLCLGAAGAAGVMEPRHVVRFALFASMIYIVAGIGAELYQGTFYPWRTYFRFAGTLHPNAQGINCAIFFLAAFSCWKQAQHHRRWWIVLTLIAFLVLYLTKSRTAFASVIAVLIIQYGLGRDHSRKVALASCLTALVVLFFLVGTSILVRTPEGITFRRGGDRESFKTLTGRTALWKQLAEFYQEKPVLGYGYAGFWNEDRTREVIEEQNWPVPHAHNAYFDTLLESGPVGMVALILIFVLGIQRALQYYWRSGNTAYYFFACMLLFCALDGVLESEPIQRSMLSFYAMIILVYLAFKKAPVPSLPETAP